MTKMPTLFVSHGSPTILIEDDSRGQRFQSSLGHQFEKPKAILAVSAHWETDKPTLSATRQPETIHDFMRFPKELYELQYPAPGAPELAEEIAALVGGEIDIERGLDHGAWTPLYLMYPEADIPVLQLSIQPHQTFQYHYDLGKMLEPLREKGVLVMASGGATHNLSALRWFENTPDNWALAYENWFVHAINANDHAQLLDAKAVAPHFSMSHPEVDHWLPLYVAMGAARESAEIMHRGFEHRNLSMACARFD